MCNLHKVSICHVSCLFSWHQNTRFHSKLPGKPESFDDFHDDLLCKGRATRGRTWWRGSRGTQRGAMTSMGSPGVVVKTDSSDGFPLQGVGDTSAAFGMCINNYWKIVIVSCKKTWPWMIYVTSSESEGISMPYLYIVFMIPQWASCIFYLFGTLWHCQIVTLPLLSWHMINFTQICSRFFSFLSAEKKVESHPMWPFFFGWSMGLAGIFGCKPDGFLMVFWSNKFRFSKRFLLKTHSKVSAGNFRVKGWWVSGGNFNPTFGIACNVKSILFCDGWLARPPAKSCSKSSTMIFFFPKSWPFF